MVLRIYKMIAISGFLTGLKCKKFVFGRGSAPDPTGGGLQRSPDPLDGLRGLTSKGRKRGNGDKMDGRGREREGPVTLSQIP